MKLNKWIKENVDFKRKETEVRDNKGYGYTLAAAGLLAGVVLGFIAIILQTVMSDDSNSETILDVIVPLILAAMLAYMVWLLLPMYKDSTIAIGAKILTTVIGLVCLAVPFVVGIYLIFIVVLAVLAWGVFWLLFKFLGISRKADREDPDLITTMMGFGGKKSRKSGGDYDTIDSEDGTLYGDRIDKDTFIANGTTYKRTYEGIVEVWKEE